MKLKKMDAIRLAGFNKPSNPYAWGAEGARGILLLCHESEFVRGPKAWIDGGGTWRNEAERKTHVARIAAGEPGFVLFYKSLPGHVDGVDDVVRALWTIDGIETGEDGKVFARLSNKETI